MPTSAELRGQIESQVLRINSLKDQRRDHQRDLDFPHSNRKYLEDANKAIARMEAELQQAIGARERLILRLDIGYLQEKIDGINTEIESATEIYKGLQSQLANCSETEAIAKAAKPDLKALQKQLADLPQEQLKVLLANMTAPVAGNTAP